MKDIAGNHVYSEALEILKAEKAALVVVDVQNDFCDPAGWFARAGRDIAAVSAVLPRVAQLIQIARRARWPVIFIQQTTLPDGASDPPAWLYFKTRDGRERTDYTLRGTWGWRIADAVWLADDDICVEKFRPSAFLGTSLDLLLKAHDVSAVVVCGMITQGCVQATLTDASYHDYFSILAVDAVASFNQALHENALTFMLSRYDGIAVDDLRALTAERI